MICFKIVLCGYRFCYDKYIPYIAIFIIFLQKTYVCRIGGKNGADFMKNVFAVIYDDKFAAENTWMGKKNKLNLSELKLNKIVRGVYTFPYKFTNTELLNNCRCYIFRCHSIKVFWLYF